MDNRIYFSCCECKEELTTANYLSHIHHKHQALFPKKPRDYGFCLECGSSLKGYFPRKFCDSSCAAKYGNARKDYSTFTTGPKPKAKVVPVKEPRPAKTKVSQCKCCGKFFPGRRTTCSAECLTSILSTTARSKTTHPVNRSSTEYNGVKLGSKYEVSVAQSLDDNNVRWVKPKPVKYVDPDGNIRQYFPDFYLPDYDVYLDPKNDYLINNPNPYHGYKDTDKIKWAETYNNIKVLVLDKHSLNWNVIKEMVPSVRVELTMSFRNA